MFSYNNRSKHLTCGFKVNTNSPRWYKSMTKVLQKIRGGDFALDVDEGLAYVSGHGDPNKLLKLMGSKKGQAAEMMFVKTGHPHHYHHYQQPYDHHPNLYHYNSHYVQSQSYYGYCDRQQIPYYRQLQAIQPYHHQYSYQQSQAIHPYFHQYSYPGYDTYGYY